MSDAVLAGLLLGLAFFCFVGLPLILSAYRGEHRR